MNNTTYSVYSTVPTIDNSNGIITIEVLAKSNAWTTTSGGLFSKAFTDYGLGYDGVDNSGRQYFQIAGSDGSMFLGTNGYGNFIDGAWYDVVAEISGTTGYVYVNGQLEASGTVSSIGNTGGANETIGSAFIGLASFTGLVDETRLSNILRSPSWILTEYNDESSPSTFYSIGMENGSATTSTPPQSLTAIAGNHQVSLSWLAPVSNGGSALSQYLISDRFTGSSTFSQVATTTASKTTSTISGLTNGQSYDFEIVAQNGIGSSTASNVVSSTPTSNIAPLITSFQSSPSVVAAFGTSTLSWNIANASSVAITPGAFSTSTLVGSTTVHPTSTTIYTITATNIIGTSTATTSVQVATAPTAPGSVALGSISTSTLSISWLASTPNNGTTIAFYSIYRGIATSSMPQLATTTSLSYGDANLASSTSYFYYVTAQDGVGNVSASSSVASGTTLSSGAVLTITSAQNGNWSATSTWTGGIVPGDNDFAIVQNHVTIDQNIGSAGNGIKRIVLVTANAFLDVNTSSARAIFFESTGTDPEGSGTDLAPASDSNMGGFFVEGGTLDLEGTQANAITLNSGDGIHPWYIKNAYVPPYLPSNIYIKHAELINLGTGVPQLDCASSCFDGINWAPVSTSTIDLENDWFNSPYTPIDSVGLTAGTLHFSSNPITGRRSFEDVYGEYDVASETITDNTDMQEATSGLFYYSLVAPKHLDFERNATEGTTSTWLGDVVYFNGDSSGVSNLVKDNIQYDYPETIASSSLVGNTDDNTLCEMGDTSPTSMCEDNISENAPKAIESAARVSYNFIDQTLLASPPYEQGSVFYSGVGSSTVDHNIVYYPPTDVSVNAAQNIFNYASSTNNTFDHNTIIGASDQTENYTANMGLRMGENDLPRSDGATFNNVDKNNVVVRENRGIGAESPNTTWANDYRDSGIDHNDVWDFGDYDYGGIATSSAAHFDDGIHHHPSAYYGDVTANPQFYDESRDSVLNYDTRVLGGPGTADDLFARLSYRSGWGGSNALGSNPIEDMRQWLFSGFAPANPALKGAASDATDIGAVAFADTTPPSVAITSPSAGAIVSSSVTLSALSTDDTGVAGVQFQIDGVNLGSEVIATSGPSLYSTVWSTLAIVNGTHVVRAVAYDTSNNTSSASLSVTVSNVAVVTPPVSTPSSNLAGGGSAYALSIDGGLSTTANPDVTLSIYATEAYMMELSNDDASFASSSWVPYATTLHWTLPTKLGTHTLYARFRAVSGSPLGNAQASIALVAQNLVSSVTPNYSSTITVTGGLGTVSGSSSISSQLGAWQGTPSVAGTVGGSKGYVFVRDLQYGMKGKDVTQLQFFLIAKNTGSASKNLAAGGTSQYFGTLTRAAVIELQKSLGIQPAIGNFGEITRAWANAHD